MARLSQDQWDAVKADYITGRYSTRALADRHNVSNAAISKKANADGWVVIDPDVVDTLIESRMVMEHGVNEIAKLNKVNTVNLTRAVNDLADFEMKSNQRMAKVEDKAMKMLDSAESPVHVKAIMDTLVKHREARLGKSPETAIQINNGIPSNANPDDLSDAQLTALITNQQ